MYTPSASRDPPKYSLTIAPMILNVLATLSALNKYGSAFGIRVLNNTLESLAAYDFINSIAPALTCVKPRTTLIMTGKKTITATMLILEIGLVRPNQLFMIGARATIGVELIAIAN